MKRDPTKGLSKLQRFILWRLYGSWRERQGEPTTKIWGLPWKEHKPFRVERGQQIAESRALLRLEQRGLVLRQNTAQGIPILGTARRDVGDLFVGKTSHVQLTALGREIGKRLTEGKSLS